MKFETLSAAKIVLLTQGRKLGYSNESRPSEH